MEALIVAFLKGEASPEKAMELMHWRKESEENEALFEALEKVFHQVNASSAYEVGDVHEAWNAVRTRAQAKSEVIPIWRRREVLFGAAAVAVIAFIIGFFWQRTLTDERPIAEDKVHDSIPAQNQVYTAGNTLTRFELIDRSTIELTPGSSAEIEPDFNRKNRIVNLKGSGTFDVVHNEARPFIVKVEKLKVMDIGTVFDIRSKGDTVKIVVSEGEVQLQLNGKLLNVAAGDSAFYVISEDLIARYRTAELRQDKVFEFNGTRLKEVVKILGEFFDRKIVIMDEAIADCPLSVTFKNENLTTILDIICELLDIKAIRNNEIIGLYGTRC